MSRLDRAKLAEVEEKADVLINAPTLSQIKKYLNTGDRVSYIGNDGLYRSGGFVIQISDPAEFLRIKGGSYIWTVERKNLRTIFITHKK